MNELQLARTCSITPCRPSRSSRHYLGSFNHGQLAARHKLARQGWAVCYLCELITTILLTFHNLTLNVASCLMA
jgi:hypothetical protein